MSSLAVFVIVDGGVSSSATCAFVEMAGQKPIVCSPAEMPSLVLKDNADVVHLIGAGHLVLPGFYEAMLETLDHTGADFCFCRAISSKGGKAEAIRPGGSDWKCGGTIVRRWVLQEIGIGQGAPTYERVVSEYRGVEVPHFLFIGDVK